MKNYYLFLLLLFIPFISFSQSGCAEVDAGEDVDVDCTSGNTVNLSASFLDIGQTDRYRVESIDFEPPFAFDAGTNAGVDIDDSWSDQINLPFNFCFFGNSHNIVQFGANGQIVFSKNYTSGSSLECAYAMHEGNAISGTPQLLPSNNIELANNFINDVIMVMHDMDNSGPTRTGDIYYGVLGEEPCRTFVVNFNNMSHYTCNDIKTTMQMVLYENTNAIDIYIYEKGACDEPGELNNNTTDWQNGLANIGIMNAAGNISYSPPGRNTSTWTTEREAWRFVPDGDSAVSFSWLDEDGNVISTNPDFTVNPTETTTYTAQAIYTNCDGDEIVATDDVTVTVDDGGIDIVEPDNLVVCDETPYDEEAVFDLTTQTDVINHTNDTNLSITYHDNAADASTGASPIPSPEAYTNTSNPQTIYVSVLNTANGCIQVVDFDLIVNRPGEFNTIDDYQICDEDGDGVAFFDLESRVNDIRVNASDVVTFHLTPENAQTGDSPLASPYENISNPQTIYVHVDNGTDCFEETPYSFQLIVADQPTVNTGASLTACSTTGTNEFTLTDLDSQVTSETGTTITYYATETDAQAGTPTLPDPYTTGTTTIWVRVENADGCFDTVSAELIVNETPDPTLENLTQCDGGGTATFDLDAYLTQLTTDTPGVDFSIHASEADAISGDSPITGNYTLDLADSPLTLWVGMTNQSATDCTNQKSFQLIIEDQPTFNTIDTYQLCDENNDGIASFDLDSRIDDIRTNSTDVVTFHETMAQAQTGDSPLSSPYENTSTPTQTIYVRIVTAGGCELATPYSFDIEVLDQPEVIADQSLASCSVTSESSFDLTALNDVVTNETGTTITYHASETDAQAGTPTLPNPYTTGTTTIWVRVQNAGGCFDTVSAELIVNETPDPTLENLTQCDGGGTATFDLDAYLTQLTTDTPGVDFSIHASEADAISGDSPITGNYTLDLADSPLTLWVGMTNQSATDCTNQKSFQLIIEDQPSFNTIDTYQLCDENNDGLASFDLDSRIDDIRTNSTDVVTFHETMAQAQTGDSPLSSPYENTSTPTQTIYVRIVTAGGCELATPYSFDIEVLDQPEVIANQNLAACSVTGESSFDLTALNDVVTSETATTITYHASETDAQAGTPTLPNPYTTGTTTIWVRVQNADGCFDTVSAELIVNETPDISLNNIEECENAVGSNVATFDFDAYLADLQATYPALTLSIHESEANADSNTSPITGTYTNTNNPETFWVRAVNPASPDCNGNYSFDLIVNPLPVIGTAPFTLEECDVNENGIASFTLTEANNLIAPTGGYTFTYHETQEAAINASDNIVGAYESGNGSVWARVMTPDGCFITTEVNLSVVALPTAIDINAPAVCSQDTFGDFDLNSLINSVSGGAGDVEVSFHSTLDDANNDASPISSPYNTENTTIYARIENNTSGCHNVAEVSLEVITAPNTNINRLTSCEIANSDEAVFNLEDLRNQIETDTGGTVTLHRSETDAMNDASPIAGNYTSGGETIWAKITTTLVDCDGIRSVELVLFDAPTIEAYTVSNCRLAENPNEFTFDTSTLNSDFTYTIYESFADADAGTGTTVNFPYTTSTDATQLYIRVENANTCHSVSTLDLTVTDFVENPLEPIVICYGEIFTLPDGREVPPMDGTYTYRNVENCTNDIYTFDFQVCDPEVYCRPRMPNAFSPNQSNVNDVFKLLVPLGCTLEIEKITIFNRWGELVYTATGNDFGWTGLFNNEEAQQGVYLWHIDYKWTDDQGNEGEQTHSGSIFLLR